MNNASDCARHPILQYPPIVPLDRPILEVNAVYEIDSANPSLEIEIYVRPTLRENQPDAENVRAAEPFHIDGQLIIGGHAIKRHFEQCFRCAGCHQTSILHLETSLQRVPPSV